VTVSPYILALREKIGHDVLLLPSVTAVVVDGEGRFLLSRAFADAQWSLVGGGVEIGEDPAEAVVREVSEELGVGCTVLGVLGVFGGSTLEVTYPNGDQVAYVATAFLVELERQVVDVAAEATDGELFAVGWFTPREIETLDRKPYVDRVVAAYAAR